MNTKVSLLLLTLSRKRKLQSGTRGERDWSGWDLRPDEEVEVTRIGILNRGY